MEASESAEMQQHPDTFDITVVTKEIDDATIESAKRAVGAVWKHNVNEPTTHKLAFRDYLRGDPENPDFAEYVPEFDRIHFAMKSKMFANLQESGLPKEARIFLLAAHEEMHRVQIKHRGDKHIPDESLTAEEYREAAHEREAWQEAVHAFKKEYPEAKGSFTYMGIKYEILEISKYK